ncbi:phosphoenolpyruvate--protein phosphotransferase [Cellulomonas sp.]|uniref:phosphoenolpyruvate--protein phosphotransferase n=1 Tax=Cellulomonas sp. TaxID=40001 RepID=UPI003BAC71E1
MSTIDVARQLDRLDLVAPISGLLLPLEQVPDEAFAQLLVGDGVSIDPTSDVLLAPCAGTVSFLHPGLHALTVVTATGVEVLLHIGLDTVTLRGEGFTALVTVGERIEIGDELIRFDMSALLKGAKSLLTQMVVTNGESVAALRRSSGMVTAGQTVVAELDLAARHSAEAPIAAGESARSAPIAIRNPSGLHARPAAVLAGRARLYASDIHLIMGGQRANAKSVTSVIVLSVAYGDTIELVADGPDATEALADLTRLVVDGLGEDLTGAVPAAATSTAGSATTRQGGSASTASDRTLRGVPASPGVAVGTVARLDQQDIVVQEESEKDPASEEAELRSGLEQAHDDLNKIIDRLLAEPDGGAARSEIFAAHRELIDDPGLFEASLAAIGAGKSAAFAWKSAFTCQAELIAGLENEHLAARAVDLRDVGARVLQELTGQVVVKFAPPRDSIVVADDLTPSDTANLDRTRVVGFATAAGGATSHCAIIAQSMGIPAVVGVGVGLLGLADGTPVILDGAAGTITRGITEDQIAAARRAQDAASLAQADALAHAVEEARTRDGRTIEVAANIGSAEDARQAMAQGADGVGLLRSEFIFMDREFAPTEDEQTHIYTEIARAVGSGRKLIIRTLDVGGDKPLPYLPIEPEDNPFLGERGIRIGLARPDVLRPQLRAILRAAKAGAAEVMVMFPMITTLDEFRAARTILEEERVALGAPRIATGLMVEVPAVALMAEQFAREADFFSIGTNDLTQYTLAMDRGHARLAAQVDALNPAVLSLIAMTVRAAHQAGRWVGVCGGLASDPAGAAVLVGLGVDELSTAIPALPAIKAAIRHLDTDHCRDLAARATSSDTAVAVRALIATPTA